MDISKFDIENYLGSNMACVNEDWMRDFLAIPNEHRCNPFDISPSGDLFWADSRNVEKVKEGIEELKKGQGVKIKDIDNLWDEIL